MGAYLFLSIMGLWLAVIADGCWPPEFGCGRRIGRRAGRAALLIAMTRIPCSIPGGADKDHADA
jgi:hypothetical protein